jgi:hypothetical protein
VLEVWNGFGKFEAGFNAKNAELDDARNTGDLFISSTRLPVNSIRTFFRAWDFRLVVIRLNFFHWLKLLWKLAGGS